MNYIDEENYKTEMQNIYAPEYNFFHDNCLKIQQMTVAYYKNYENHDLFEKLLNTYYYEKNKRYTANCRIAGISYEDIVDRNSDSYLEYLS